MAFTAGQKLRVSDLGGVTALGGGTSRMTADVTVNNSTTVTDSGLSLSVLANATYSVSLWLRYNTINAADIKLQWSSPSGTTGYWSLVGHGSDSTTAAANVSVGVVCAVSDIGTAKNLGGDSTGSLLLGTIGQGDLTTTTAGTFKLQVAQATANASNTVLRAGSRMILTRLA